MSVRSAISGRFASKDEAEKSPKTTVSEAAPAKAKVRAKAKTSVGCPKCKGKGLDLADYSQLCDNCHGSGQVSK